MRIIFVAFLAIATVILCLFMTGCAQRYESGHDQLFELSERHIIYRDLTVTDLLLPPHNATSRQHNMWCRIQLLITLYVVSSP